MNKIRVAFDARMIDHPGIGRYIQNLLSAMTTKGNGFEFLLYGDSAKLKNFKNCRTKDNKSAIYSLEELFTSPFNSKTADITHIPHFNVPLKKIDNLVITIHDLIYLKFGRSATFLKSMVARPIIANSIKNAKRVIAVSENTKKDIIEYFPKAKEKVAVIYEACDPVFRKIEDKERLQDIQKRHSLPKDFILFVGTLKQHKNISALIDAYNILKRRGLEHKLVIVGRYGPREKYILDKISASDVLYLGEVGLEDLVGIYNLAGLLVLPSLYEGFGFPAVEAMACGVPVAASNAASLPEVVGNAGILFDPYDTKDIADKIYQTLKDENLRKQLIEKGFSRVADFSWGKAAQQTLEIYKEVVSGKD